MRPTIFAVLGWAAVLGLAAYAGLARPAAPPGGTLLSRLLGPIGALAASAQWVRFDAALKAGRPELAYARARLALELDARGTQAWSFLGAHFATQRASREAESDPRRRVAWIRAGLSVLEQGEQSARSPEDLAFERGLLLGTLAGTELAETWPGGSDGAFEEAIRAFRHAAELGHPMGAEMAELAARAQAGEPGIAPPPQDDHDHDHDPHEGEHPPTDDGE